ncbi:MAG: ATP-binding cassette domain-containing protein [Chitinivibrionales bacterium]|nr:ATP-binding cassette domain-containing protein [Chitinivibrionales bacterium]
MNPIEVHKLTRVFGNQIAVDHISFDVKRGEIFGFLGANGAGKTTAIRMLCGLLQPSEGKGSVAGFDIVRQASAIRSRIGYMSQKFSLYTDLSVEENMRLFGSLYGLKKDALQQRISTMASFLGLEHMLGSTTGSLPWGWQQRLSLACANLHEPDVLFLDEPTGSVDPVSRRNFWDLIHELARKGRTIFVTTHHMDEAENCGRISIMVDGKIAAMGSPQQLKTHYGGNELQDAFIAVVSGEGRHSNEK